MTEKIICDMGFWSSCGVTKVLFANFSIDEIFDIEKLNISIFQSLIFDRCDHS